MKRNNTKSGIEIERGEILRQRSILLSQQIERNEIAEDLLRERLRILKTKSLPIRPIRPVGKWVAFILVALLLFLTFACVGM